MTIGEVKNIFSAHCFHSHADILAITERMGDYGGKRKGKPATRAGLVNLSGPDGPAFSIIIF